MATSDSHTRAGAVAAAEEVARLDLDGVKIHHLYVSRNTALEKQFRQRPFPVPQLEDYVRLVCDFIERMPPRMVIQRLMGELSPEYAVAPRWEKSKGEILALIDREFDRRGTRQGSRHAATGAG